MNSYGILDKNYNGKFINLKINETIYSEAIANYNKTSSLAKKNDK